MIPDPGGVSVALGQAGYELLAAPALTATGWESHVYRCETTIGLLAVRVHAATSDIPARREAGIMGTLQRRGYPVPFVHGLIHAGDHPALIMDFVDGTTLENCGWPNRQVAETCIELMHRLHRVAADSVDPLAWLRDGFEGVARRMPRFAPYASALLANSPPDLRSAHCHLDFHPANVLWDGSPWVIDWTSGRVTDPQFDFAWTRLLSAMYDPVWLEWLPTVDPWFETAMAFRRLATVASMLADGGHTADFTDGLTVMQVPGDWLERGTGVPVRVESLLGG